MTSGQATSPNENLWGLLVLNLYRIDELPNQQHQSTHKIFSEAYVNIKLTDSSVSYYNNNNDEMKEITICDI